jgi:hypothetical protein
MLVTWYGLHIRDMTTAAGSATQVSRVHNQSPQETICSITYMHTEWECSWECWSPGKACMSETQKAGQHNHEEAGWVRIRTPG